MANIAIFGEKPYLCPAMKQQIHIMGIVNLNDIDLCMRIGQAGYRVIWTPFAELYHYESKSRGGNETPEKSARLDYENGLFKGRWKDALEKGDPYYNPNLTLIKSNFSPKNRKEEDQ